MVGNKRKWFERTTTLTKEIICSVGEKRRQNLCTSVNIIILDMYEENASN